MKKRRILIWVTVLVAVVMLGVAFTYVTLAFDPCGWGKVSSSKFSWEKFATIRKGESINAIVARLGDPIRPAEFLTTLTSHPRDPCRGGRCKKYLFSGGIWGPTFREAIVIVDPKGYVLYAFARQE
jgi:hypothetical protein